MKMAGTLAGRQAMIMAGPPIERVRGWLPLKRGGGWGLTRQPQKQGGAGGSGTTVGV